MKNKVDSSVLIMMATFNGAEYIKKQIDSIIAQDYTNWKLIIQDDFSTDNTYQIINDYCQKDSRISCQQNTSGKNGPYYNFHNLANRCKNNHKYNYYMFCDQDDVWDVNKISKFLSVLENEEQTIPLACYADMRLIDETDNVIGYSIEQMSGIAYVNKYSLFFSHIVSGCNMMINAAGFFQVPHVDLNNPFTEYLSHDNLYIKYAAITGNVVYIDSPLMSYRRHSGNVTFKHKYKRSLYYILTRVLNLNDLAADHALTYNQSLFTIRMMKDDINDSELEQIEKVIRKGGLYAILYIKKRKINWGNHLKNISRKTTMVLGLYKKYLTV